jgi:predicted transglutaminase-like cysteine proteinase
MEASRCVNAFFASFFLIISVAGTSDASTVLMPANRLFGTSEFRVYSINQFPQWDRVLNHRNLQRLEVAYPIADENGCVQFGTGSWCRLIKDAASLGQIAQLEIVNSFFNSMPYRSDRETYGVSEYWATPTEFMTRSGDCEDYSIAKYFALRELGFDVGQMRIVILRDEIHGTGHAVLAVTLNQENLILDNTSDWIVSDTTYKYYAPQYSLNETGFWVHVETKIAELDDLLATSSGIELSVQEKSVLTMAPQ